MAAFAFDDMPMNLRNLPRLTKIGLVFFILGLLGVAPWTPHTLDSSLATDVPGMHSLLIAAALQLTGYVLLNVTRFGMLPGRRKACQGHSSEPAASPRH